ncbi:MAG TPA: hypothetical protein VJ995_00325 [Geothermobacteraceae bacterium]|nr:hypothetical protein [Geothermobacteraceae bacterium]
MMYPIAERDVLTKVSSFTLQRRRDTLDIQVSMTLAGKVAGCCFADATFQGQDIDADFWGYGDTETAALRDLLTKIHGRPFSALLPTWDPQNPADI